MHPSVMAFVRDCVVQYELQEASTLEVGSMDVNGSVRSLFKGRYLGVDMAPGPGVDVVLNAHELERLLPRRWELIVCCEMLEHDDAPWITLEQMAKVAWGGAHLILTCRGFDERGCWPVHGYPDDMYRFSRSSIRALLERTGWRPSIVRTDPEGPGVLALAWRGSARATR